MVKLLFVLILGSLSFFLYGFEIKKEKVDNILMTKVTTPFFNVTINPLGGRFWSIFSKTMQSEIVDTKNGGSGTENIWNIPNSRFFLRTKPFSVTTQKFKDRVVISSTGNHQGGGINFLKVYKNYTLWKDQAKITVDYKFENMDAAMSPLTYGFWFHHMLGEHNVKNNYYFPSTNGITCITFDKRPVDTWQFRIARPWMGNADPKTGKGVAITMSYPCLKMQYAWFAGCSVPSTEWRFEQVTIDAGKTFSTQAEILPFTGLKKISGAGNSLVGELRNADIETDENSVPVEVIVHSAQKNHITAQVYVRKAPNGKWKLLKTSNLVFSKAATLQSFKVDIKGDEETLQEIEVILKNNAKELARLNGYINFNGSEEKWSIQPLEAKKIDARSRIELLKYNNVNKTPHIPWANPLVGGKIKTLVLTDNDAILETGELAQRLQMDFTVPFLMGAGRLKSASPSHIIGEYFGMLSTSNLDDNLKRALDEKHDLIIIAGLPWKHFSNAQQKSILAKVKNGSGLIYIGPQNPSQIMPIKVIKGKNSIKAVPKAIKKDFTTLGIPWELFGKEPIYRYQSKKENVLVTAENYPYLVTSTIGKGKVFFLNYVSTFGRFSASSAFTPDFEAEYNNRIAPYEFYYSLIAKLALAATNRIPKVTIEPIIDSNSIKVKIISPIAQEVILFSQIRNNFMQTKFANSLTVQLKKGTNIVNITNKIPSYAQKLNYSLIMHNNKKEVINWGTWTIENKSDSRIDNVVIDKKYYNEGDFVSYQIKLKGKAETTIVKTLLVDSFDRTIAISTTKGTENIKGKLKITNSLCSRFYTLKNILLDSNNNEIDHYNVTMMVRPSEKSLEWKDFEIGTWVSGEPRKHLWPLYSSLMHKYQINTLISNWITLQKDFAIRQNIHPTRLHHLGITRCAEPVEYAKTGNKLLLIRKPCLSDPEFLKKYIKAFTKLGKEAYPNALRFYWMGDEQSITGYGGVPVDFCFSSHCLKEFKKFLQNKYGSLKVLNNQWNSNFTSWDQVLPFTKDEIWKDKASSVAGWADHLEFMDSRLENVAKTMFKALKTHDPKAHTSLSGTQPSTAYGGMDWSRLMKHFDGLMNYALGGQFEIQRSLRKGAELMPWEFGYIRSSHYRTWRALFCGMKGMFGYSWYSLCNPDGTPSPQLEIVQLPIKKIKSGLGIHWINNLQEKNDIALLYSQSSIRGAFIEKRHRSRNTSFDKYNLLLRQCGYNFNYISSEQLENGILLKDNYKKLILMDANALSDKEIAAINKFVSMGGKVFAEGIPGRRYSNCRLRKTPALNDIFNIPGNILVKDISYKYLEIIEFPNIPSNYTFIKREQDLLREFLGPNNVPIMTNSTNKQVLNAEFYHRIDNNNNSYIGITTPSVKGEYVKLSFKDKKHIYDLVSGKYFGYVSTIELPYFNEQSTLLLGIFNKQHPSYKVTSKSNQVTITFSNKNYCTACDLKVFDPNGKEIMVYNQRILVKNGVGKYIIPFALSDKKGIWKCVVSDIVTKKITTIKIVR